MLRPSSRSRPNRYLFLLLCLILTIPAMPAVAQSDPESDGDVRPVVLSLSQSEVVDPGQTWLDGEGLHTRSMVTTFTVDGDLTGTAEVVTDLDWFGPCDAELAVCEGGQDLFSRVELHSDGRSWSGTLALQFEAGSRSQAHGILIGRHGTDDEVIVLDAINEIDDSETFELSGRMVTLTGPIAGVQLTNSACITGPTTADGGFIGTRGLILDNGPARIMQDAIGGSEPLGLVGEVRQLGHKGNLRGIFTGRMNGQYAHGSFVLAGESGAYNGLLGYGRASATLTEEPRCQSGIQMNTTWTGQARYLIDPASFLAPRVYFSSPTDDAVVSTPVVLELGAENVQIEAAGQARDGAGYLTVIVDAPCIGPGEPIPVDDEHIHLTEGETSVELGLFTGQYRLCLQLTDGAGIAQPATDVIMIRVASSGGEGPGGF